MIDKNITFEEFKEKFADYLGLDAGEINWETNLLFDLGIDSLSLVNSMVRMEKEYNLQFRKEDRIMVQQIGKIYEILLENLNMEGDK